MTRPNRLLIVETNQERRNEMTRHFLNAGFQVTPVRHPRQALEASTFKHFDAAVLSDQLPEITAPELARRLRQNVSGLRPVLVSSDESEWDEVELELTEMNPRDFDEIAVASR